MPAQLFDTDTKNLNIFAKRFKQLRYAHRLSINNLAILLNFKNNSSITYIESGKTNLSLQSLIRLANLFAVNTDWLFGRSDDLYSETIILALESEFTKIIFRTTLDPKKPTITFLESCPESYKNIAKRGKYYTLAERANLLFLMQYYMSLTERYPELMDGLHAHVKQSTTVLEAFKEKLLNTSSTPRYKNPDEEWNYLLRAFWSIIGNEYRNDAFDEETRDTFLLDKKKIFAPLFDVKKTTVD